MKPNNLNSKKKYQHIFETIENNPDIFDIKQLSKIQSEYTHLLSTIIEASSQLNLDLSANQYWQLLRYLDTLLLWNKTYNLTAITNPQEASIKHIVDCMSIVPTLVDRNHHFSTTDMLDIGAGAGLPSIIVAICQPERICSPLDSNQKKIRFIRQVATELELSNVKPVASRIENFDGKFKLITSRAFASLTDFVNLAQPYLEVNGQLLAMKGKPPLEEEIDTLNSDWHIETLPIQVPFLPDSRHLIKLSKK